MRQWIFPLWVIIDVLIFIVTLALWITAPEYLTLNISLTAFTIVLGVVLALARKDSLKVFMGSAYFKKVVFHSFNAFLVIAILSILNYLGNKNSVEFDLTKQQRNSLAAQSLKVISMVKEPLSLTVFSRREEWAPILNLLKLYTAQSKHIKLDAVDTDLRPDLVKAKNISQNGTVVVKHKGQEFSFVVSDELSITNALLKAVKDRRVVIYFTGGHQELSCYEKGAEGLAVLCERLRSQNYETKDLDLTKTKDVPADATAVIVAGPTTGFLPSEVDQLARFLKRGGSLFLALAPAFKAELYDSLVKLAEPYGLRLGRDIVIDRLSTVQGAEATIPITEKYDLNHPITAGFNQRTVFPLSASVSTMTGNDSAVILAFTSPFPGSWAEADLKGVTEGKATYNEKTDSKGPIGLLGISEATDSTNSRFVLLGSSSFLVNAYQNQSGNSVLFLNAVSWMVDDEGIISFNRPGIEEYPVILSAQHLQIIFVISILLVPIIFFGCGILVYRRRRIL